MRAWVLVLAGGCYHPTFAPDVPCTTDHMCPAGLQCDTRLSPPLCVSMLSDAGAIDTAPPDIAIDAFVSTTCASDADCPEHVCSESAGMCIDPATALFVATTGSDTAACTTEATPCATISGALAKLTATRRAIRVAPGTYTDSFLIATAQLPILISATTTDRAATTINHSATGFGGTTLDHDIEETGTDMIIEGLTLAGAPNEGVRVSAGGKLTLFSSEINTSAGGIDCNASTVVVERSDIESNTTGSGIGLAASGTGVNVTVDRSRIRNNAGVGISLTTARYTITNSLIAGNGGGGVAVVSIAGTTHRFDYNTIADNGGATVPVGMRCAVAVSVGNSIFSGNGTAPQIDTNCSATYTLFSDTAAAGTGNVAGAPAFVGSGDYHITASSAARNIANPGSTETTDYDGEMRPQGAARDVGADEVP